jgi:hypothetical protein
VKEAHTGTLFTPVDCIELAEDLRPRGKGQHLEEAIAVLRTFTERRAQKPWTTALADQARRATTDLASLFLRYKEGLNALPSKAALGKKLKLGAAALKRLQPMSHAELAVLARHYGSSTEKVSQAVRQLAKALDSASAAVARNGRGLDLPHPSFFLLEHAYETMKKITGVYPGLANQDGPLTRFYEAVHQYATGETFGERYSSPLRWHQEQLRRKLKP